MFLKPRVLQPGFLTTWGLSTSGFYNGGSDNQRFFKPGVLQPGVLESGVLTSWGLTSRGSYNQGSYNQGFLKPLV